MSILYALSEFMESKRNPEAKDRRTVRDRYLLDLVDIIKTKNLYDNLLRT